MWQANWNIDDMWLQNDNDNWPAGATKHTQPHGCPLQDYPGGNGKPLHAIVEDYAKDQDPWVNDFLIAIRKMQHNGYAKGDLVDGPDVFNGHIKCEKVGGVFSCRRNAST